MSVKTMEKLRFIDVARGYWNAASKVQLDDENDLFWGIEVHENGAFWIDVSSPELLGKVGLDVRPELEDCLEFDTFKEAVNACQKVEDLLLARKAA